MHLTHSAARPHGPGRTPAFVFSALMLILGGAFPLAATAQSTHQTGDSQRDYAISGGALDSVLLAIARHSGARISYDTELVRPYHSAGLQGRYTPRQAIETVLRGTPLRLQAGPDGQWFIQRQAVLGQGGEVTTDLPTINVNDSFPLAATLTEDSPSYTADAVQIGSNSAQSLREIPQSVSVVTQQQIRDQGLRSLDEALASASGISVTTSHGNTPAIYSRSFAIRQVQVDGGTPLALGNVDLATYDHVEILRGADGIYAGRGDPGGTINLVRKRPTDQWRYSVEGNVGSWNDYSTVLDAGGPLGSGPVRGRLIAKYGDKNFFYDTASERDGLIYGITETTLSKDTLLTLGGSLSKKTGTPNFRGVPLYLNGDDSHLPRSASFIPDWAFSKAHKTELFGQLDHNFNQNWSARLNVTHIRSDTEKHQVGTHLGIDPVTQAGPILYDEYSHIRGNSTAADIAVNGRFPLLGREHDVTVGGSYYYYTSPDSYITPNAYDIYFDPQPVDIRNFDSGAIPRPELPRAIGESPNHTRESSYFARFRFHLSDRLRLGLGARVANFDQKMDANYWDENGQIIMSFPRAPYEDRNVLTKFAGLTYDLTPELTLYASYADVYQAQSEFFKADGSLLKPVIGSNVEIGAKSSWLDGRLQTTLALYNINQNNAAMNDDRRWIGELDDETVMRIIDQEDLTGGHCCFVDSSKLISRGVDLEVSGEISTGWNLSASYNYNRNKWKVSDLEAGSPNHSQTPMHQFKLWTSYRLPGQWQRWTLAAGVQAQSRTYESGTTGRSGWGGSIPYRIERPGHAIYNAAVSHQFNRQWQAQLNINNVFDKRYYRSVNTPSHSNWYGTPRSFLLTVRGQF